MPRSKGIPGVLLTLLDTKRNTTTLLIDVKNHHFNLIAELNDLRWVNILVCPVHFRDVYQTFDTLLDFRKTAVVREIGDTSVDAATLWVTISNLNPWIFTQLLQTQGHPVTLSVELENLNVHFLADFNNFARMLNTLPRHISDV